MTTISKVSDQQTPEFYLALAYLREQINRVETAAESFLVLSKKIKYFDPPMKERVLEPECSSFKSVLDELYAEISRLSYLNDAQSEVITHLIKLVGN